MYLNMDRIASEESQALGSQTPQQTRGSMILYRLASDEEAAGAGAGSELQPPRLSMLNRNSVVSTSGDSIWSLSSDSKYPNANGASSTVRSRGLIPYAYDPFDTKEVADEDGELDPLHEYAVGEKDEYKRRWITTRGVLNVGVLLLLVAALLTLFIAYPVITFVRDNSRNLLIAESGSNTNGIVGSDNITECVFSLLFLPFSLLSLSGYMCSIVPLHSYLRPISYA